MSFGSRIVQARKDKSMSQDALAKALKTTPTTVGRYERDEVKSSIEMAAKIAEMLEVSLDYLIGSSTDYIKDKNMLKRLNDIATFSQEERDHILFAIDAMITKVKLKGL